MFKRNLAKALMGACILFPGIATAEQFPEGELVLRDDIVLELCLYALGNGKIVYAEKVNEVTRVEVFFR